MGGGIGGYWTLWLNGGEHCTDKRGETRQVLPAYKRRRWLPQCYFLLNQHWREENHFQRPHLRLWHNCFGWVVLSFLQSTVQQANIKCTLISISRIFPPITKSCPLWFGLSTDQKLWPQSADHKNHNLKQTSQQSYIKIELLWMNSPYTSCCSVNSFVLFVHTHTNYF